MDNSNIIKTLELCLSRLDMNHHHSCADSDSDSNSNSNSNSNDSSSITSTISLQKLINQSKVDISPVLLGDELDTSTDNLIKHHVRGHNYNYNY